MCRAWESARPIFVNNLALRICRLFFFKETLHVFVLAFDPIECVCPALPQTVHGQYVSDRFKPAGESSSAERSSRSHAAGFGQPCSSAASGLLQAALCLPSR